MTDNVRLSVIIALGQGVRLMTKIMDKSARSA